VLQQQGRFAESLAELRRGHELGSRQPGWRYPSANWVRGAARLVELEKKLPAYRQGDFQPRDNEERLGLIQVCQARELFLAAARLSAAAFAAEPARAEDLRTGHRYRAARLAALAAAGRGEDAAALGESGRARWRRQAVAWLRADLPLWAKRLKAGRHEDRAAVARQLRRWQAEADLAGLRDDSALKQLPADEREACLKLWADVEALLRQASGTR
jgi:serine/threonine-protein kinase